MLIFNIPTPSIALKIVKWVFPLRPSLSQNQRRIINGGFHQIPPRGLPQFHRTNELSPPNCSDPTKNKISETQNAVEK